MAIQHLLVCVAILKCHEDSKKPSECFAHLFVSAVWVSYSPKDNRGNGLASFVYCVSETFTVLFFREVFVDYRFVWYFGTDASSTFEFGLSPSFADFRAVSACRRAAIFEHTAWRPCVTQHTAWRPCVTPHLDKAGIRALNSRAAVGTHAEWKKAIVARVLKGSWFWKAYRTSTWNPQVLSFWEMVNLQTLASLTGSCILSNGSTFRFSSNVSRVEMFTGLRSEYATTRSRIRCSKQPLDPCFS